MIVVCFEGVGLVVLFCAEFGLLVVPLVVLAGFVLVFLVFFIRERIGHLNPKIGGHSDIVFANTIFIIFPLTVFVIFPLGYFRFVLVIFIVVLTKTYSSVKIPVFLTNWFVIFIIAVLILTKSRGEGSFLLVSITSVLKICGT